jgi:hypothetical protein
MFAFFRICQTKITTEHNFLCDFTRYNHTISQNNQKSPDMLKFSLTFLATPLQSSPHNPKPQEVMCGGAASPYAPGIGAPMAEDLIIPMA